ncbi:MAG: carboxy-S-adenosyl-L-methionine synthase CmoA [Porticoccus sp.]|nr:MAG: carboxy-S-adenosyl-L-methionine synthase CmoA [Porticoccus sp.]
MNSLKDTLFATPQLEIAGFRFDRAVARVFPDMIRRSVPGYETIIAMTGTLAERYVQPGSQCYDLGCSLGASTLAMRHHIRHSDCRIIAVDNSAAMLSQCREILAGDDGEIPVELICGNIEQIPVNNATMAVLNFTLQFIPVKRRNALLQRISDGLQPGGVLVLSEKVAFEDLQHQQLMIELHHHFKRANGYSELEISQKRSALEDVLVPETLAVHRQRLREAGFSSVDVWFQCFNFASLIAIK